MFVMVFIFMIITDKSRFDRKHSVNSRFKFHLVLKMYTSIGQMRTHIYTTKINIAPFNDVDPSKAEYLLGLD